MRWFVTVLALVLAGCASPRAVLVNDKREYTSCAATSVGLIGSAVAQHNFDKCVAEAKEKGYRIESEQK
jgi:uncharacterized lipoprotein YmbA